MQDGDGWYRRAVNEGLEPATQYSCLIMLFMLFMLNCNNVVILRCEYRFHFVYASFRQKKNFRYFYVYDACMNVCYCNGPVLGGALQRLVSERSVPLLPIHSLPAIATIIVSYFSVIYL